MPYHVGEIALRLPRSKEAADGSRGLIICVGGKARTTSTVLKRNFH